jgi:hypothetical protein
MSEFFTLLLREAESGWVWMYTAGMPDDARAARVDELESDAWEHETEARERGGRFGMEFLHRFAFGMPADVGWRVSHGREGFEPRNWLELLISCLLVVGLVVALPVAAVLLPHANPAPDGHSAIGPLIALDCLLVILVLVLPGVLVIDRWPIAGGLLVIIGCFCLMALFWWLREAMGVIVVGAGAAAVSALRLYRLSRDQDLYSPHR